MNNRTTLIAAAVAITLPTGAANAQSAYEFNRLNQAVQICNSPMGAGMAECAKLRGQLGGGGMGGFGGGTAGKAAGIAGPLGSVIAARGAPAPTAAPAAPGLGIDINKAITACVARAAADQAQIDRCLAIANGGAPPPR